ncbi:MAG: efflux RND transporter periplasmic adaptor subunit, partial [Pseudomonadota bacterium]
GKVIGQITELQGRLRAAELNLSYTDVAAPFAGRVGLTDIDVGAFVGPDSGTLVNLSSIDPIYVTFPVPEAVLIDGQAERAASDDEAPLRIAITLANGTTYGETGTVAVVDTQVQAGTDTVLVRASFPNPEGRLIDGQLVTVRVARDAAEPSIVVPATALQRDQGGYFVYVIDAENTAERRGITPGAVSGASIVVAEGLAAGEQVIVEGLQRVRPGAKVDPAPAEAAPAPAPAPAAQAQAQ